MLGKSFASVPYHPGAKMFFASSFIPRSFVDQVTISYIHTYDLQSEFLNFEHQSTPDTIDRVTWFDGIAKAQAIGCLYFEF